MIGLTHEEDVKVDSKAERQINSHSEMGHLENEAMGREKASYRQCFCVASRRARAEHAFARPRVID